MAKLQFGKKTRMYVIADGDSIPVEPNGDLVLSRSRQAIIMASDCIREDAIIPVDIVIRRAAKPRRKS